MGICSSININTSPEDLEINNAIIEDNKANAKEKILKELYSTLQINLEKIFMDKYTTCRCKPKSIFDLTFNSTYNDQFRNIYDLLSVFDKDRNSISSGYHHYKIGFCNDDDLYLIDSAEMGIKRTSDGMGNKLSLDIDTHDFPFRYLMIVLIVHICHLENNILSEANYVYKIVNLYDKEKGTNYYICKNMKIYKIIDIENTCKKIHVPNEFLLKLKDIMVNVLTKCIEFNNNLSDKIIKYETEIDTIRKSMDILEIKKEKCLTDINVLTKSINTSDTETNCIINYRKLNAEFNQHLTALDKFTNEKSILKHELTNLHIKKNNVIPIKDINTFISVINFTILAYIPMAIPDDIKYDEISNTELCIA